jgi:hypothetical protein
VRIDRRGIVASVLAFVYPGLGHVYLRSWLRAVGWFVLAIVGAALVVPESAYAAYQQGGMDALLAASEQFGMDVFISLLGIRLLNVVDAYLTAIRQSRAATVVADENTCPACGKELDPGLEFCHWCTTRLDEFEVEEDEADGGENATLPWQS